MTPGDPYRFAGWELEDVAVDALGVCLGRGVPGHQGKQALLGVGRREHHSPQGMRHDQLLGRARGKRNSNKQSHSGSSPLSTSLIPGLRPIPYDNVINKLKKKKSTKKCKDFM